MMIMKKNILYLLAFIGVIFAACNPLKDEINNLKPIAADAKTLVITTTTAYPSNESANTGIVALLNKDYVQMPNGTKANVTYSYRTNTVKPADSLFNNVQYTVTDADYTNGSSVVGNGSFKTYNTGQVLNFLEWKYPQASSPVNKLVLLTYNYFQSGATTSAGVVVTEAFLLLGSGWQKIYLVSPTQYASVSRGVNNSFVSTDVSTLPSYFNSFLKNDAAVMGAAKAGDLRYVTYKYYQSSTISHQKIYLLQYDGSNWSPNATLSFIKRDGKWIPDPTVYYTMLPADYTDIADNAPATIGNTANRANLKSFKNFNLVTAQATGWATADVEAALIFILNKKFPSAAADPNVIWNVSFVAYTGSTGTARKDFIRTSNGFVIAPVQ
jgi:hypothetical protein